MRVQAIYSGQAGVLAIKNAGAYTLFSLSERVDHEIGVKDLKYVFQGVNDIVCESFRSIRDAQIAASLATKKTRAVRLFLMLIDPAFDLDYECADLVEVLIGSEPVREYLLDQLLGAPMTPEVDLEKVLSAYSQYHLICELTSIVRSSQYSIVDVRERFLLIPYSLFESEADRNTFLETAIDTGCVRALVEAVADPRKYSAAKFALLSKLSRFVNYRSVVEHWTRNLGKPETEKPEITAPREKGTRAEGWRGPAYEFRAADALQNAMSQQSAIINKMRSGDFETARRFANDLLRSQLATGEAEHAAKSMTRLSQFAKESEAFDLNLEWASLAVQLAPTDPRAHGQLADALLQSGRFAEAIAEFKQAEAFGDVGYALTGRARVARTMGDLPHALELYRTAREQLKGAPDEHFAWAGVAEVLRDLGELDKALEEYSAAAEQFGDDSAILTGRASLLGEMGRLHEAWLAFRAARALPDPHGKLIAELGFASLFRRGGRLDEAQQAYEQIAQTYPDNLYARSGLIDVLRSRGRFEEAVSTARALAKDFPGSPTGLERLALVLAEAGIHDESLALYEQGKTRFDYDVRFWIGLAAVKRQLGAYSESLVSYEQAATRFPRNMKARLGRAGMLRRLLRFREAQNIYTEVLAGSAQQREASNALASIHIIQSEFSSARNLLFRGEPTTRHDWRSQFLVGALEAKTQSRLDAMMRYKWAIEQCRFKSEIDLFRSGLALLHLGNGNVEEARRQFSTEDGIKSSNVVYLHSLAASSGHVEAQEALKEAEARVPETSRDIVAELASQFDLVHERPKHSIAWLLQRESEILILEAA